MRVLVLGAYGLIGSAVVRELLAHSHEVIGLGRNIAQASQALPAVQWLRGDLADLTTADAWTPLLRDCKPDAIVNCSGVLQDGPRDDVFVIQSDAIRALIAACEALAIRRFVQISATRATADADTGFMRSKAAADAALATSTLDWWILRPGLVLSPQAYGGSALLRALAAMPLVLPIVHADCTVQTVAVTDVTTAARQCLDGAVPTGRSFDLVETDTHTVAEVVMQLRAWLGLPPAPMLRLPDALARPVARIADGLTWLGWRSPLRTTAMREIKHGVRGDSTVWQTATGTRLLSLRETLQQMPATVQERWFARLFLLKPMLVLTLAAFWCTTAVIAIANSQPALSLLAAANIEGIAAQAVVFGGAAVDALLGLAVLHRRTLRAAALAMVAVTVGYLVGGTLLLPSLWLDPLGPLVKPIPAAALALVLLAIADDR